MSNPGPIVVSERCHGKTAKGARCKKNTLRSTLCWQHLQKADGLRIKPSGLPNGGLGLYTTVPRARGHNITEYSGAILESPPADWRSHYALQIKKNPVTVIDAKKTNTAPGRFANSAGRLNNAQFVYDARGRKAHVRATKPIPANGEVFAPYGRSFGSMSR